MTKNVFRAIACMAFVLLPLTVQAKGGTLSLSRLAHYEKGTSVPKAVKDECDLEKKIIEAVRKNAEKNFDKIVLVDAPSAGTPGKALSIRITDALAPRGGTASGYKTLTIKGTLWQNGKVAGSFTARRVTSGGVSFIGYKGTCSMLQRCAKTLGKDVATWLEETDGECQTGGRQVVFIFVLTAGEKTLTGFLVCRACSTAWKCESSTQPDGGEGLAKRKGVIVRWGLKEAWSKHASR